MAKVVNYKIRKRPPYIIEGEKGEYQIPPAEKLDFEDGLLFDKLNKEPDPIKRAEMAKSFLLKYAPALENEDITPMEYSIIFNDYNVKAPHLGE